MNTQFDKAAFAALLKKAIGNQTQKDFAKQVGISKEHLSRLINQKLDSIPSMETIQAICRHTTTVSYPELLEAAGYSSDLAIVPVSSYDASDIKPLTATILASMPQFNITWTVETGAPADMQDLNILLKDCPLKQWFFHCMNNTTETVIQSQFESNYLKLLFDGLEPDSKYSFVTASVAEYEKYVSCIPQNLSINLSIILVNQVSLKVLKETLLKKNGCLTDDILNLYTF